MISFACPYCARPLQAQAEFAGRQVLCPGCGGAIALSGPDQHATTVASPPPCVEQTVSLHTPQPVAADEVTELLTPPQAADELGRLGPYRVLRLLGRGGMGAVFQAEDPQLGRLVALKVMLPGVAAGPVTRQRFLREARTAAAIEHDNIVTVYQVGEDRGVPFMAMAFLRGEPLDARLKREGRLPVAEAVRVAREIAQGLAAAHKRQLIHRDIKPANVWIEEDTGRVKILDFGLARTHSGESELTQAGAIIGTPAYMAPEQANGQPVDPRCDLFSLGCVLYRMTTGGPAFHGQDLFSTIAAVATHSPPPPAEVSPDVPAAVSDFVLRLLEKNRDDRPPSAQAVVAELQQIEREFSSGTGFTLPEPRTLPTSQRQRGPARARRWWPLALVACLALVGAAVAVWPRDKKDAPHDAPNGSQAVPPQPLAKGPRSCILLWMSGGPSQLETFDPKAVNADYPPMNTSVPGLQICSTLPRLAKQAHHLAIVRTMSHRHGDHAVGAQVMRSGYEPDGRFAYPSLGCVIGKELARPNLPRYVWLGRDVVKKRDKEEAASGWGPAFLGPEYGHLPVAAMLPPLATFEELAGDRATKWRDAILPAFDFGKKKPEVLAAYGRSPFGQQCLLASRMAALGVPFIEVTLPGWDWHSDASAMVSRNCEPLDEGFSALLQDLHSSGHLKHTLIVWMGEFGRTARRNKMGGRDHSPMGFSAVLAGGLVKGGRVFGQTSDTGDLMLSRAVTPAELFATIYAALGIDPNKANRGPNGVEVPLVERGTKAVAELLP